LNRFGLKAVQSEGMCRVRARTINTDREKTMSHPTSPYTWTYSEYARFPDDGNRYEVIDGEVLVTPAPSPYHQHILFTLGISLRQYADRHRLGVVLLDVDLLFVTGRDAAAVECQGTSESNH
jgi:Uma2 family endonuclease